MDTHPGTNAIFAPIAPASEVLSPFATPNCPSSEKSNFPLVATVHCAPVRVTVVGVKELMGRISMVV
jgi:hypothetical protein